MQGESKVLEDLARVAAGAMGVAQGMRQEVEARLKDQFEKALSRMDLVTREEFDVVRAMAEKARDEQEELLQRVQELEAALKKRSAPAKKASPRKAAGRKPKT
jgi:BMFP domain-containing protein YqiC